MSRSRLYLKFILNTILGLFVYSISFSQITQPARFEKEWKYSDEDFTIIPLKSDGLALIREKNKFKAGNNTWEIVLLDTTLQETGTLEFEINIQNRLVGYEHSPGEVHILFVRNEVKGYMDIISINLTSKEISRYEIKPELSLQLTHFSKVGSNFIFGGFVNRESAVLLYNPVIDNLKVLPGFFQKDIELIDMRVNQNQTFNTLLVDRGDHDLKKIIFRTFDSSGKLLLEDLTNLDDNAIVYNGITSTLQREDMMIVGTWGKLNSKQASGFYALPVNPFDDQKIKRIHFAELSHYLDYLKPKRAASITAKTLTDIENDKIPDFTNYAMPFKIIEHIKGFWLMAESYSPSNTNNQYPVYSPYNYYPYYSPFGGYYPTNRMYGQPAPYSYGDNMQNSEDVKIVQTVVIGFDTNGRVISDFSFKLDDVKRSSLEQISDFYVGSDSLHIFYKKESELNIKAINLETSETTDRIQKIKLNSFDEEIRSERKQDGLIKHWFDKNFYVWGYQTIRNRSKRETKEVFYINKVVVP